MRFKKVYIEITNICNLHCSFCPEVERTKNVMSVDFFKKVLGEVKSQTEEITLHLMGEPLSHPQILEIFNICEKEDVKINLTSNGILLKRFTDILHSYKTIKQINFSLHSFFDNYPDKDINPYLETIFKFSLEFDNYINYRLWNEKSNQLTNEIIIKKIEDYFSVSLNKNIDVGWKKSKKIKNKIYLHVDSPFVWPSLKNSKIGETGFCYGLTSQIGILTDGTVVPCCLDKEAVMNLGSLKNESLNNIINNPRSLNIINGFNQFKAVEELCQHCSFRERFNKKIPAHKML